MGKKHPQDFVDIDESENDIAIEIISYFFMIF